MCANEHRSRGPWFLALVAISVTLIGGCAAQPVDTEATGARVQQLLDSSADIEPARCLSTHAYQSVEVLDDRHVVFEGSGDRRWLNQLRSPCVGLRRNATLLFDLHTNQICNLDSFSAVSRVFWFWQRESGMCTLGSFHPVSAEQVEMVRRELRR